MVKVGNYNYELSTKKDKKLMVVVNGKTIHFGQAGYQHYFDQTELLPFSQNHFDPNRRDRYRARAKMIKDKDKKLTVDDPESANYHAYRILWR